MYYLNNGQKGSKKRLTDKNNDESSLVAGTGLEPATFGL